MIYILSIALVLILCVKIDAEMYTSVVVLERLLETERRIIEDLELYVQKEEKRLHTLKRYLNLFKREHDKAMGDIPDYMANPINAFTLLKRLTVDLDYLNYSIKIGEEIVNNSITMTYEDVKYPNVEDLIGATRGLARLQKMYNLDVQELAEGKLNGDPISSPMTASDCYELGRRLYDEKDYIKSLAWMLQAFRKYNEENVTYFFTDNDILDYFNGTCYQLEDPKSALEWIQKLLEMDPEHLRAIEMLVFYETLLSTAEENSLKEASAAEKPLKSKEKNVNATQTQIIKNYEALCRGDLEVPIELSSKLTCRYMSETHPFLTIAPFKIEMMYLNPNVTLFHDIVSDSEIETIKQLAAPNFRRASVKARNGTSIVSNIRTSQLSWLEDRDSETVARITRRVSDMTGLSTAVVDRLQVLNYGIGGHYEPHFDFFGKPELSKPEEVIEGKGNRFVTTLFYMSDVAEGGATVFPLLGIKVAPVKGTAIMWYNLLPSGSRDTAMKHAACPVLLGSKWVFTKWIYQVGQELIRPCSLEYELVDHHSSKLLKPVAKTVNQAIQYSP